MFLKVNFKIGLQHQKQVKDVSNDLTWKRQVPFPTLEHSKEYFQTQLV